VTARRALARVLAGLLVLAAALLVMAALVARAVLAPLPGEWAVPLRLGPVQFDAGMATLIRLATSPRLAPLMHGRTLATRAGPVHLSWQADSNTLALRCAPCTPQVPGLGEAPLALDDVGLTVRRQGDQLSGELSSGKLQAAWHSLLEKDGLRLHLALPMTPLAQAYALFGAAIPELAQARIEGRFSFSATLGLPGGDFSAKPQIESFQVSGLGTEALLNVVSGCSPGAAGLNPQGWLARAVLAAEDQRFYEHTGYDLAELAAALAHNQRNRSEGHAGRGASTLSQQLAKLLLTGDERSPVRKLRELLYAVEMERTLGKPRILQLYLAHAPWGPGICGAEAAAQHYFARPAEALEPLQAAWLAAMLHNPALEAERWASTGEINVARTQWVLQGIRPMGPRQFARLNQEASQLDWRAPPRHRYRKPPAALRQHWPY
jgi:monofunctional biosynthetic peptidoglycan transglycosylase